MWDYFFSWEPVFVIHFLWWQYWYRVVAKKSIWQWRIWLRFSCRFILIILMWINMISPLICYLKVVLTGKGESRNWLCCVYQDLMTLQGQTQWMLHTKHYGITGLTWSFQCCVTIKSYSQRCWVWVILCMSQSNPCLQNNLVFYHHLHYIISTATTKKQDKR